ncbi:similar to diacylglycerol kinase, delta 130kDa isoform 1 (predicted), isoform CRA_f [Rattus norvegicus]|uniref:Similar to diacylglycerol kinase, delta 130kDa isoform 1 (Predicted), isoform CRA_f n=1 Tax=Rattus norvegicus TaxID=10116 RepID=A6JQE3_RAT|nr:similar to diacylglycerol kinase, delta 130kDa isoform 1 (predicted), isoform CRA_f [Rattus norvegicus]
MPAWQSPAPKMSTTVSRSSLLVGSSSCVLTTGKKWKIGLQHSRLSRTKSIFEPTQYSMDHFSGTHNWYACSHARPTYCNVCREVLSGVTSHGLSCEGKKAAFVKGDGRIYLMNCLKFKYSPNQ